MEEVYGAGLHKAIAPRVEASVVAVVEDIIAVAVVVVEVVVGEGVAVAVKVGVLVVLRCELGGTRGHRTTHNPKGWWGDKYAYVRRRGITEERHDTKGKATNRKYKKASYM